MAPWLWMLLGLALIAAELLTPGGFYLLFFGVAALLVGALSAAQVAGPPAAQWIVFSVLSVVSALLFRKPLLQRFKRGLPHRGADELIGETAIPTEAIAAGDVGRAELRGTTWSARNVDAAAIQPGERCVVERVDGLVIGLRRA